MPTGSEEAPASMSTEDACSNQTERDVKPDKPTRTSMPTQSACPVKLDRFDGSGDIDRFLAHFDVVAKANAWSPSVQLLQLPACLTGSAFDFFRRLPSPECATIDKLKETLRKEYDAQALETDYALLFAARKRQPGESMVDYSEALRSMGRKAYPTFSEQQLEILCRSHFINGVDEAVRVQLLVGGKDDETYRQLVRRARQLEQVMAPAALRRVQSFRGDDDTDMCMEMKRDVEKLTSAINALEKRVSELSVRGRDSRRPPGPCPECGQNGHWRRECPKKGGDSGTHTREANRTVYCFKCRQPGHYARGCAHFQ